RRRYGPGSSTRCGSAQHSTPRSPPPSESWRRRRGLHDAGRPTGDRSAQHVGRGRAGVLVQRADGAPAAALQGLWGNRDDADTAAGAPRDPAGPHVPAPGWASRARPAAGACRGQAARAARGTLTEASMPRVRDRSVSPESMAAALELCREVFGGDMIRSPTRRQRVRVSRLSGLAVVAALVLGPWFVLIAFTLILLVTP